MLLCWQGAVAAVVHKGSQQQQQIGSSSSNLQQLSDIPGGREVLTMGPGAFFGERALLQQSVVRPASMVAKGQTLLLSLTRRRFEECLGPLSALTAAHGAWQQWLGGQGELMHRNSPGPKFAELIAVSWAWPCHVLCEGEEYVCICWGISSGGGGHRG